MAAWLRAHPGVEVVARDRSTAYAEAVSIGAPDAVQVADRFHLVQNASAALDELVRGCALRLEPADPTGTLDSSAGSQELGPGVTPELATRPLSASRQYQELRREARVARWRLVRTLAGQGLSIRAIAREIGINRKTVKHLLESSEPPRPQCRQPRAGGLSSPMLLPWASYLRARWEAGCTNASQLSRELVTQGYKGSSTLVSEAVRPWRGPPRPRGTGEGRCREWPRQRLRWLCLRPPGGLKSEERAVLALVLAADPELARGYELLQGFRGVVARRDRGELAMWLEAAKTSSLPTFVALANGLAQDREAVEAGLRLPWSSGVIEGHINRLKLIKRVGYGRAGFELLRTRVLSA